MGYSKNKVAIDRVRKYLEQMAKETGVFVWESGAPHKLSYQLREGIAVAKQLNDPLGVLAERYVIRTASGRVIAQPRMVDAIEKLKESLNKMVLEDIERHIQVMASAVRFKADEMFFPNVKLSDEHARQLYEFAQKNEYFLVVGDGVTLTREDPGEAAWKPKLQEETQ